MIVEQVDPLRFVEEHFTLQGKPFILLDDTPDNARHYLQGMYNTIVFRAPVLKKPIIIVKGRQVEMTTTMNNLVAYYLANNKFFDILYTFPKGDQAKRFSDTRFDPLLRYMSAADILPRLKDGTYNKSVKQFANGSTLFIYGAADKGDNIRSIAAQMLIKDEYQDMDKAVEETIDETLTHSKYKLNISLGTPKYTATRFEERWKQSNMMYYNLFCESCGTPFVLTMDRMVKEHIVRCPKCKHDADKRLLIPNGKWMHHGEKDADYLGFHLSQLYVPYITLEELQRKIKQREQEGADVERYIKNEILGEFYSGIRQQPDRNVIRRAFNRELPYDVFIPMHIRVYMGIDWGGWNSIDNNPESSYTVVSIGAFDKFGNLRVNYIEVIDEKDEMKQVDRVSQLIDKYHVYLAVADKGYGKVKNHHLKVKWGNRFKDCKYLQGSAGTLYKEGDNGTIMINRDYSLEELYSSMGNGNMQIPHNDRTEWIIEHFLNHEIMVEEHGGTVYKRFVKVDGHNKRTDAVHSINYLRIAAFKDNKAYDHSPLIGADKKRHQAPRPRLSGSALEGPTMMKIHKQLKAMRRS